jgi:hypothetical protein
MQYTIGKLVTTRPQPHRLDSIMLTENLHGVAGYLTLGEVATILRDVSTEGWIHVLGSQGKHGYIHYTNLKIIA